MEKKELEKDVNLKVAAKALREPEGSLQAAGSGMFDPVPRMSFIPFLTKP